MALISVGWDLGGAHLKAARAENGVLKEVRQAACPLWQGIEHLDSALRQIISIWPQADCHTITMTGELVDLFPDRAAGVAALAQHAREHLGADRMQIYAGRAGLIGYDRVQVAALSAQIASANWLASASFAATRQAQGVLFDIGSTTTDIVPFAAGNVLSASISDSDRLGNGELLYTGAVRTPVCAIADRVPFDGQWQSVAAEFFATMADVYRLLERLPEQADLLPSADGRGKTIPASTARLARMLGRDAAQAGSDKWRQVAAYFARRQEEKIHDALDCVLSRHSLPYSAPFIGAGSGRFIVKRLAAIRGCSYLDFADLCNTNTSGDLAAKAADCAPAVALALLAHAGR